VCLLEPANVRLVIAQKFGQGVDLSGIKHGSSNHVSIR
jgi:hypothetical protein